MKTILVIDDQAIFREPIEAVLRAEGHVVLTASNGAETLVILSTQVPDLVLLDLGMPVMDGISLLRTIRKVAIWKKIPVMVLSAEADRTRIVEAVELGISGYLLKSQFSLKSMLERVTKVFADAGSGKDSKQSAEVRPRAARTGIESASPEAANAPDGAPSAAAPRTSAAPAEARTAIPKPASAPAVSADADLKAMRPIMTRSQLLERLNADGELTGFSPSVSQVLKLTSGESASIDQVAKAVGQDPAVAIKILKLANSSVYSRGDRIDTVHKAVLRIGMQSIRQAVLNIGVMERFGSAACERHLSTPLFWEHSLAVGIIAAEIAHALNHKQPDAAFTTGLLHDLGRMIFAERLGDEYARILAAAAELQLPLEQVETKLLLMSHAEAMDKVLHAWRFPRDLVNPIVFHHSEPGLVKGQAPRQVVEVLRLALADRLAHAMLLGSSGNETIYPTDEHCRLLGVEAETIRVIEETARQQTNDTKFAMLSTTNSAVWPNHVEKYRSQLPDPFRPVFIGASPEFDAYRIICAALAGLSQEPPNLAVVHISAAKTRGTLSAKLVDTERELGLHPLPTLVLSPGGQFALEDRVVPGRRVEVLTTPTPLPRFIATIRTLTGVEAIRKAA